MIRAIVFATAALSLSACGGGNYDPPREETPVQPAANLAPAVIVADFPYNDVRKFCDEGRAIYAVRDDNATALAVVEDARECPQPAAR